VALDWGRGGEWARSAENGSVASLTPQSPQKLAASGFAVPQAGQSAGVGVPHAVQNLVPGRLTWWQFRHSIKALGGSRAADGSYRERYTNTPGAVRRVTTWGLGVVTALASVKSDSLERFGRRRVPVTASEA
jgi:hypothetical protein